MLFSQKNRSMSLKEKTLYFGRRGEVQIGNFHISSFSCLAVPSNIFNHGETVIKTNFYPSSAKREGTSQSIRNWLKFADNIPRKKVYILENIHS